MTNTLLYDLAVVMAVAGVVTVLFHRINQPVVLGYILAGVIIGPNTPQIPVAIHEESMETLAELGVVFLLFSLGLEFNLRKLARVGIGAGLAAVMEITVMVWVGYNIGRLFGWSTMDSIFLGAMMSISSSMILFKLLHASGRTREPFAQFIFGILVIEDLLAVAMLGLLSSVAMTHTLDVPGVLSTLGRLGAFLAVMIVGGLLAVPPFIRYVRRFKSEEMLLVGVLGVCFGASLLAVKTGFSTALGAFVAGAVVAEARENRKILALIGPVRDLFSAIFFVAVGMHIDPAAIFAHALPILAISAAVVFGKFAACASAVVLSGNSPRMAVRVGLGMTQIGEFSYIIAALGLTLGVTGGQLYPVAVCVSALTIFIMPQLFNRADGVAAFLERRSPPPLVTALMAYGQWVSSLSRHTPANLVVRRALRRSLLQILLNLLMGSGVFITAASLASRHAARPGWWDRMPDWSGGLKTVCWFSAVLLVLPLLIAVFRKIQAVAMILSEMAIPSSVSKSQVLAFRSIATNAVLAFGTTLVCAWLLMLSAIILPPWPMLSFLAGVAILVGLAMRGPFIRLYARGQLMIRELFAAPAEAPGHPIDIAETPVRAILEKTAIAMVAVGGGGGGGAAGQTIRDINLRARTGANIVGIERDGASLVNPGPEEMLQPGDNVILLGNEAQINAARLLLRGPEEA